MLWLLCVLLGMGVQARTMAPASGNVVSLCDLQRSAKQGERRLVRVRGIYSSGFKMGVLADAACPSQHTWVELDLKSDTNKGMLRSVLAAYGRADVVFEGEFYGPGIPDPKLPESIRKSYLPGWGHLGAFSTKLVVRAIEHVNSAAEPAPPLTDICTPLAAPSKYNGLTVRIHGRLDFAPPDFGLMFASMTCSRAVALTWNDDSSFSKSIGWKSLDLAQQELVRDFTRLHRQGDVSVSLQGVFEVARDGQCTLVATKVICISISFLDDNSPADVSYVVPQAGDAHIRATGSAARRTLTAHLSDLDPLLLHSSLSEAIGSVRAARSAGRAAAASATSPSAPTAAAMVGKS